MIFHLVPKAEWDMLLPQRPYIPSTYTKDGFIHCSGDEATMLSVANRFYKNVKGDVLLLVIDEGKLKSELRWEGPVHPLPVKSEKPSVEPKPLDVQAMPPEVMAEVGAQATDAAPSSAPVQPPAQPSAEPQSTSTEPRFPHVYGPINREAIVEIRQFVRDADGSYTGSVPLLPAAATPALPDKPAPVVVAGDPSNPLNLKSPSQMADELLEATDNFSEALKRYKDRVESHIDDLDKNIKRSLGD